MSKALWFLAGSFIAMSAAVSPAYAADAPPEPSTLEPIVVTAQRRSENVQEVPIAISVVTADQASALGAKDTRDLAQLVPGLNFTSFTTQATPVIRGIGTNVLAEGDENDVAIYVDGIYQQTPNTAIFNLADVDHIEVVKGPQGTLFGRNAVGGVINVSTLTPTHEPHADLTASYGNYDTITASGLVSGGVADNLAGSLAVYYNHQAEGFGTNLHTGADVFKDPELSIRNKWRWAPSEQTTLTLSGAYNRSRNDGVCLRLIQGELGQDGKTTFPGFYNINADATCFVKMESIDVGLNLEQDLGFARLISNTGYNHITSDRPGDSYNTPVQLVTAKFLHQRDEGWTEELQLQSKPESRLKWIVGYFYLNGRSGYPDPGIFIVGGAGPVATQILGMEKVTSNAGFAQASYDVLPRTTLTLGGRYTSDERAIDGLIQRVNAAPAPILLARGLGSARFNKFTWRLALDHQINKDLLVYASINTGFKAGLYNLSSPTDPPVRPESLTAYEAGIKSTLLDSRLQINAAGYYYDYKDLQVSSSVVINGTPLSRELNAATATIKGFDVDVRAVPVEGFNLTAGLAYTHARYTDFPNAITNIPDPTGVVIGGRPKLVVFNAAGNSLLKAPDWTFNLGGDYTASVGAGSIMLAANVSYMSEFYWNFANTFREPAKTLVNASVSWNPSDHYRLTLWGRNLLDRKYLITGVETARGFVAIPGPPITFGITLGARF
jgi:iron complex outermembrane receptor protein